MSNKNKLKIRINKLLELKNKNYRKKFYLLSRLSESNIINNEKMFEEFRCLAKTLNKTNGSFPEEQYINDFIGKNIVKSHTKSIKESANLKYSNSFSSFKDLIQEELNNVSFKNQKLDNKLEDTLIKAVSNKIGLFESYTKNNVVDLTNLFKGLDEPKPEDLAQITSDDSFEFEEDSNISQSSVAKIDKITNKIIDIFGPITNDKDPKSISKKDLAEMLGFKGNGRYVPGQKTPVLSGWDVLELKMMQQMSPYGRDAGLSTVGQRKWWIFETIKFCLMLEKQANFFLGLSEEEKSRLSSKSISKDEKAKIGEIYSDMRGTSLTLSDSEIRQITRMLQEILLKGDFNLDDSRITEAEMLKLLRRATSSRPERYRSFIQSLNIMYPLQDTRPDFAKVPVLSDEEREQTQGEVEDYFRRKDIEDKEVYGNEIDPETGEPIYADEDQIAAINANAIDKKDIIQNMSKSNYLNMTSREVKEYFDNLQQDLERLNQLKEKMTGTYAGQDEDIFRPFDENEIPDINNIPDVIPAEGLTDGEKKEMEEIIERIAAVDVVNMINDSEREAIYQELVDKAVTVDEFIAFNKRFGLDNPDKPMTWEDIKRASAGAFTGPQGARQYGVKAWIKSVFFNFTQDEKSEIYSYLAERWYDRLKQLDLVDDQAFAIKSDKVNPNDPTKDKAIPRKVLDAAEEAGKYKRSQKLVDISNMLELVSKYTSPKYVKRYFDEKRADNLPQSVREKLHQIQTFASSVEEYDALIKRLETEDPDTMAYAVMDSMFNDKSGFRIFATGMLKEYYNNVVWPQTEVSLAQAVKEYFAKNYPAARIAASLGPNEGADAVRPDEGKDLFNKIIYVAMERTGIKTSGKGVPNIGDSVEERKDYLRGNLDSRGDFSRAVAAYNTKYQSGKNPLKGKSGGVFNKDDVEDLVDDIFNQNTGIIGKVSGQMKRLNATSAAEFITWAGNYPEAKLDQAIVLGMSLSDFYRRDDADAILTLPIEEIGKDTAKALKDYKKKYGKSQLMSSDFVEWLDDFLGMGPIDIKSKGAKNPGGKNFQ